MKNILYLFIILLVINSGGCLIFHTVKYEIKLETKTTGTVKVTFADIQSDSENEEGLNEDKGYLFDYALKSNEFLLGMKEEGKEIISRRLFEKENKLYGEAVYKFNDINGVENIYYDEGLYYLTLPADEIIHSTNGEVFEFQEYKRIIWDDSFETLEFELLDSQFAKTKKQPLLKYLNK